MKEIKIIVADKIASVEGTPIIICGNGDYVVNFTFDDEWNNYPKRTARFVYYQDGLKKYIDAEFEGNICVVPVLVNTERATVGVYADGMKTTTGAEVRCKKSILCEGDKEEQDWNTKFWGNYQDKGNRQNYDYAFAGSSWTDEIYDPKYPIVAESYIKMFYGNDKITSTKVPLDFSGYSYDGNEHDVCFCGCSSLKTIPSLKVGRKTILGGSFDGCTSLEYIGFLGELWCEVALLESENLTDETIQQLVHIAKDFVNDEDETVQELAYAGSIYLSSNCSDRLWELTADERFPENYQGMFLGDILDTKGWGF